jgi:hypothetical protein
MASPAHSPVISLRLTPAETERFWKVMEDVKKREHWASKSDVIRELTGLSPLNYVTDKQAAFFRANADLEPYVTRKAENFDKKRKTG